MRVRFTTRLTRPPLRASLGTPRPRDYAPSFPSWTPPGSTTAPSAEITGNDTRRSLFRSSFPADPKYPETGGQGEGTPPAGRDRSTGSGVPTLSSPATGPTGTATGPGGTPGLGPNLTTRCRVGYRLGPEPRVDPRHRLWDGETLQLVFRDFSRRVVCGCPRDLGPTSNPF